MRGVSTCKAVVNVRASAPAGGEERLRQCWLATPTGRGSGRSGAGAGCWPSGVTAREEEGAVQPWWWGGRGREGTWLGNGLAWSRGPVLEVKIKI